MKKKTANGFSQSSLEYCVYIGLKHLSEGDALLLTKKIGSTIKIGSLTEPLGSLSFELAEARWKLKQICEYHTLPTAARRFSEILAKCSRDSEMLPVYSAFGSSLVDNLFLCVFCLEVNSILVALSSGIFLFFRNCCCVNYSTDTSNTITD